MKRRPYFQELHIFFQKGEKSTRDLVQRVLSFAHPMKGIQI